MQVFSYDVPIFICLAPQIRQRPATVMGQYPQTLGRFRWDPDKEEGCASRDFEIRLRVEGARITHVFGPRSLD
jgi:hypothetical protein